MVAEARSCANKGWRTIYIYACIYIYIYTCMYVSIYKSIYIYIYLYLYIYIYIYIYTYMVAEARSCATKGYGSGKRCSAATK